MEIFVNLENTLTSAERLVAVLNAPSEAPAYVPEVDPPPPAFSPSSPSSSASPPSSSSLSSLSSSLPLSAWPVPGVLTIKDLRLRYRPGLPLALRGVNVTIQAGERIGVVGRTGAGKSSIMTALLRTTEPEQSSRVLLDNQDCRHLGTHALRSRAFNLIPQDAVVFSGTLRFNLDPTAAPDTAPGIDAEAAASEGGKSGKSGKIGKSCKSGKSGKGGKDDGGLKPQKLHHVRPQPDSRADGAPTCSSSGGGGGGGSSSGHGDDVLMRALRKVGLDAFVRSKEEGLEFDVGEGGSLLSHGQRQLLVIARALLRPGRILLVDEATSSVDLDTDAKIQALLRVHFREVRWPHYMYIHSVY